MQTNSREVTEKPRTVIASLHPETPVPCTLCATPSASTLRYVLTLHPQTLTNTTHAVVQFEVPQHIGYVGVRGDEDQVRARFVVIVPGGRQVDGGDEGDEGNERREQRRRTKETRTRTISSEPGYRVRAVLRASRTTHTTAGVRPHTHPFTHPLTRPTPFSTLSLCTLSCLLT